MNKSSKSISANISTRFQLPLKTNTTFNRTQIFIPYLDNNNVAQIQVDTWTSLSNSVNYNFEKIRVGIGGGFDFTTNGNKDQSIKVSKSNTKTRIVISRSHPNEKVLDYINQYKQHELIRMGSSLKLCCIADGKADIYPRLGPSSEWDIGAAQGIVEQPGRSVLEYPSNNRLEIGSFRHCHQSC